MMGEPTEEIKRLAIAAAERHGLDPALVMGVCEAESGWDPLAIGDNGHSVGLMQLHDGGAGVGLSVEERQDPATNLEVGTAYLRQMQNATNSLVGTLAAYNGGLGAWQRGTIVWEHIENYLQAYLRWTLWLMQDNTLPHLDAAYGYCTHKPRSYAKAAAEIIAAKRWGLGLP